MSYTKTRQEKKVYSYQNLVRVNQGPWSVVAEAGNEYTFGSSFTGDFNPSWRSAVRVGKSATTIASGAQESVRSTPFLASLSFEANGSTVDRMVQGDFHLANMPDCPSTGEFPGLSDSVYNAVLARFLNRCTSEQRKLQGGVVLGELRKTIAMIRRPLNALEQVTFDYVSAVRRRARQLSPRAIPRMIINEYLSYTYGAIPLFADIKGAYDACIRLRDLPQLVKVRAFASEKRVSSQSSTLVAPYSIPGWVETSRTVEFQARIIGAVKVASVGPVSPLQEATGFRLRDFVPTIYELIPYSFLVDYFVNVNDIINALSFAQADLAWHCQTTRSLCVVNQSYSSCKIDTIFGFPVTGYSFLPSNLERTSKSFFRTSTPLGIPSLVFKLASTGQSVNIAALAAIRVL
jgi:hypothetical protein